MDRSQVSQWRSEVITSFIGVEQLLNCIISQHYFKAINKSFFLEVLYDAYFDFGLRRRILEKFLPQDQNAMLQPLNRMAAIRNYFAHCGLEVIENVGLPILEEHGPVPDPRNPERPIDFEKLFNEFKKREQEVVRPLAEVFRNLGGECDFDDDGRLIIKAYVQQES
jgi:hypothetical protein